MAGVVDVWLKYPVKSEKSEAYNKEESKATKIKANNNENSVELRTKEVNKAARTNLLEFYYSTRL